MEITFAWFWIIKAIILIVTLFIVNKAFKEFKRKKIVFNKYTLLVLFLIFVQMINPIKINGTNSNTIVHRTNNLIEISKVLPVKVEDNSFSKVVAKDIKITKEELK